MLAELRALADWANAHTPERVTFRVELSRAYKRRRYMLSYLVVDSRGYGVQTGTLVLLDLTAPELYVRPLKRTNELRGSTVNAAYRALALQGELWFLLGACEDAGIPLQRYSETPDGLADWILTETEADARELDDEAAQAVARDAAGLAPRDSFDYGR